MKTFYHKIKGYITRHDIYVVYKRTIAIKLINPEKHKKATYTINAVMVKKEGI